MKQTLTNKAYALVRAIALKLAYTGFRAPRMLSTLMLDKDRFAKQYQSINAAINAMPEQDRLPYLLAMQQVICDHENKAKFGVKVNQREYLKMVGGFTPVIDTDSVYMNCLMAIAWSAMQRDKCKMAANLSPNGVALFVDSSAEEFALLEKIEKLQMQVAMLQQKLAIAEDDDDDSGDDGDSALAQEVGSISLQVGDRQFKLQGGMAVYQKELMTDEGQRISESQILEKANAGHITLIPA